MYSDAAKRCSDAVNLALHNEGFGRWLAIRLSDGGTDGNTYNSMSEAISHQLHESQCAYLKITPDGMGQREAELWLAAVRKLYDKGFRITDPDANVTPILPYKREDYSLFMRS
jgi:hypothetical protein